MKKYQVEIISETVLTVPDIIAENKEEAFAIASEKASQMSLDDSTIIAENSNLTLTEDATPEEIATKVAARLENGDFELIEDDNYPQTNYRTVTVPVNTAINTEDSKEEDTGTGRHMLDIEVAVDGKAYNTCTTDGPRGRTLYCERGFTCKKITPVSLKVDGVPVSPLSDALKKSLQDILDDTDAIEDFNSSQMY